MDNLLKNKWFVRILSFLIALMLYTVVTSEQPTLQSENQGSVQQPEKIENVKLSAFYDEEQYILEGVPDTVTVRMSGPGSLLRKASLTNDHQAFIDLQNKQPGSYTVPVQVKGYPDGLTIEKYPPKITVELHEKATATFPVKIKLLHKEGMPKGYTVKDLQISPEKVTITGAKDVIKRIAFVRGYINMDNVTSSVEKEVSLNIYDVQGNEMNIATSPESVTVDVTVSQHSKNVTLKADIQGSLPEGKTLQSVTFEPQEVEIFGEAAVLKELSKLKVPVDLSGIKEDKTLQLKVPVPADVKKVEPEKVDVMVDIAEVQQATIQDVPVKVVGADSHEQIAFLQEQNEMVSVQVKGPEDVVTALKPEDIKAVIDVSGLSAGEHTVDITYQAKQSLTLKPKVQSVDIQIESTDSPSTDSA